MILNENIYIVARFGYAHFTASSIVRSVMSCVSDYIEQEQIRNIRISNGKKSAISKLQEKYIDDCVDNSLFLMLDSDDKDRAHRWEHALEVAFTKYNHLPECPEDHWNWSGTVKIRMPFRLFFQDLIRVDEETLKECYNAVDVAAAVENSAALYRAESLRKSKQLAFLMCRLVTEHGAQSAFTTVCCLIRTNDGKYFMDFEGYPSYSGTGGFAEVMEHAQWQDLKQHRNQFLRGLFWGNVFRRGNVSQDRIAQLAAEYAIKADVANDIDNDYTSTMLDQDVYVCLLTPYITSTILGSSRVRDESVEYGVWLRKKLLALNLLAY